MHMGRLRPQTWRSFLRDRKGNFAVMTAFSVPFAICLAAVAIDHGALYTERRELQAFADLAAITAAANIEKAQAAALTALQDNGLPSVLAEGPHTAPPDKGGAVVVTPGRYSADPSLSVSQRFEPGRKPYNAVSVSLKKKGTLFFGTALMAPPTMSAEAVASTSAQAAFSVGSRLLKLDAGILNALLGALTGSQLSLSAMDYKGLAEADVDLLTFIDALATHLDLSAATYDDVLSSKATVGQIAAVLAGISSVGGSNRLALQAIAAGATTNLAVPLSHLIDLGPVGKLALGQTPGGLPVKANILSLLGASAALSNGSRQVDINLGATIPGLAAAKLAIAIGEPMQASAWLAVGEAGTEVHTAQTRLRLTASVGVPNPALGGGVNLLSVNLPLHVEVASAEAKLTDINCLAGRPDRPRVSIAARPGVATLRLADSDTHGFADFSRPQSFRKARIADVSLKLLLLKLDLLGIEGQAMATISNGNPTTLTFDSADIAAAKTKTVSTRNLTQSLTESLINNLTLSVNALGLGLDVTGLLGTIKPAVTAALSAVTEPLDTLLYNVLTMLGVGIGQADVRVTGATCGRSVLVQ